MSYSLRLFFAGLVALVRERDGTLHALLLNTEHQHHAHFPVLLCDDQHADCRLSAASEGAAIAASLGGGAPLTGYLLSGEEIALRGAAGGRVEPVVGKWRRRWYHDFVGTFPGSHDECADCGWIAPMRAADPARGSVAPRHLRSPRAGEIAGKLSVRDLKATLRTFRMSEVCDRIPSLTFKRPGTRTPVRAFRQALADTAVLEVAAEGPVTFELTPFAGEEGEPVAGGRTLTVAPRAGAREADVILGNLTPLQQPLPCSPGFVPPPAHHFELFYHLAATPPPPWEGMLPIPHPGLRGTAAASLREPWPPIFQALSRPGAGAQGTIERPMCTLAFFDVE
jgi:hypothetical protein